MSCEEAILLAEPAIVRPHRLNVSVSASPDEIKSAYRQKALVSALPSFTAPPPLPTPVPA